MKIFFSVFIIFIFCSAQTCSSQDEPQHILSEYSGCCGSTPVEFALLGSKQMFVPNVFTPNDDEINDYFIPSISSGEGLEIQGFTIYSAVGDTILFQQNLIRTNSPAKDYGWSGNRKDGSKYKGLFRYGMVLFAVNFKKEITGTACCLRCDAEAVDFKNNTGCFYPVQSGSEGTLDKTKSNGEKSCL